MSKTRKKDYSGSKKNDNSCCNNSSCDWCRDDRTFRKSKARYFLELDELEDDETDEDITNARIRD
jgi:hypothetical protein